MHAQSSMGSESPTTYAWALSTGGDLSPQQRKTLRRSVFGQYVTFTLGAVSSPFRRGRAREPFEPVRPDSQLARLADEAAAEQPPELVGHGYRTWMLGAALADHDDASLDPEQFYVVAILHDSGLTESVLGEDFTIRSAQTAMGVCDEVGGCDEAARTAIADAIVAHFTPGLERETDAVGFYVQAGATADLSGFRFWDMAKGQIRQAYNAQPSHGAHRKIAALVKGESEMCPNGRARLLVRTGFHHVVRFSPLSRV